MKNDTWIKIFFIGIVLIFIGVSDIQINGQQIQEEIQLNEIYSHPILEESYFFDQPPELDWKKIYGNNDLEESYSITQTTDGGYFIVGCRSDVGIYLIKTDQYGGVQWSKIYGYVIKTSHFEGWQTSDGGYIIVGCYQPISSVQKIYLLKLNSIGEKSWEKIISINPLVNKDVAMSIKQTSDGGYIITGGAFYLATMNEKVFLLKTDRNGNQEWIKFFCAEDNTIALGNDLQLTSDGGFIIVGMKTIMNDGNTNVWLCKTNSAGVLQWERTFGGLGMDIGLSVQQTIDGGYIAVGQTTSYNIEGDTYLIKVSTNGNKEWEKYFDGSGSSDIGFCIRKTDTDYDGNADDGFIIAGITAHGNDVDDWIIKTDLSGNEVWNKSYYASFSPDGASSIWQTSDGGFVITGYTASTGNGDIWLIKLKKPNEPPVVTDIPDQTIEEGSSFQTISLDNYVSDPDNSDAQLAWTYSGNSQLMVNIVNHIAIVTIPNPSWNGTEVIKFKATDPGGLWDDDAVLFTVLPKNNPPVACFSWIDADITGPGTLINFDASCSTDDHGIMLYEWDWNNDGSYDFSSDGSTATHDYGDTNTHTVVLRVTDTINQIDTETKIVQASYIPSDNPPVACFSWIDADITGPGTLINFDASCSTDDHGIMLYEWDWNNDGSYDFSSDGSTATHDYGDTNTHTVVLRVTDTINQMDTFSDASIEALVTIQNQPPVFGNPSPMNNSNDHPLNLTWSLLISDPEGDAFDWTIECSDRQSNSDSNASNGTKYVSLYGLEYGDQYILWVNATDPSSNGGSGSYTRKWYTFTTQKQNNPPYKPTTPNGETSGKNGVSYTYESSTIDYEGDQIFYWFDWGDGTNSGWLGSYKSGDKCQNSHIWNTTGSYSIKVKAKDIHGNESVWSDPLPITMPYRFNPILQFLERLFQRFPNAFPLLRY